MNFEKNQLVLKVIEGAGQRTATIVTVERVMKRRESRGELKRYTLIVHLEDSSITYDEHGNEIDPALPGWRSYLVNFDGGELERWGLK